jgi:signal transduction histidine kinase
MTANSVDDSRVKILLLATILVMTTLPAVTAVYFLDRALQTSLNLGFNARIEWALDQDAAHLKALRHFDPVRDAAYRQEFGQVQDLRQIYSEPAWVKARILGPLRLYFGLGLAAAVAVSVLTAVLLSRKISRMYRATLRELLEQRERVRFLEQMSSWQELARMLAHEIKNPLTPIEVLITSLTGSYMALPPAEFAQQLRQTGIMIGEELQHLKHTVSRFSEFARLPQAHLVETDPAEVIERCLPLLEATFSGARLRLNRAGLGPDMRVRMDATLFRQVLLNIVRNGVEANPGRQVVFSIAVTGTNELVHISIANDGVPVPAELAEHLFEPYMSGKATHENMGLGLAIVRKIIVEHDGEIRYAAAPSGEPCFTISLPRRK